MVNADINTDYQDEDTIMQYKIDVERQRGYNGPCLVDVERLKEIHLETSKAIVTLTLYRLKLQNRQ